MNTKHSAGEKKQAILLILMTLIDDSDKEHPLSQEVIGEKLSQRGLNLRRAAISENIERINASLGQDTITHIPNKGYYFAARFLSDDEIFLLTNLIYASNEIEEETKYLLVDKIRQTLSVYQRNNGRIAVSYEKKDSDSNSLDTLTKCSLVRKAIQRKKKIRFYYQRINEKGERYLLCHQMISLLHFQRI